MALLWQKIAFFGHFGAIFDPLLADSAPKPSIFVFSIIFPTDLRLDLILCHIVPKKFHSLRTCVLITMTTFHNHFSYWPLFTTVFGATTQWEATHVKKFSGNDTSTLRIIIISTPRFFVYFNIVDFVWPQNFLKNVCYA